MIIQFFFALLSASIEFLCIWIFLTLHVDFIFLFSFFFCLNLRSISYFFSNDQAHIHTTSPKKQQSVLCVCAILALVFYLRDSRSHSHWFISLSLWVCVSVLCICQCFAVINRCQRIFFVYFFFISFRLSGCPFVRSLVPCLPFWFALFLTYIHLRFCSGVSHVSLTVAVRCFAFDCPISIAKHSRHSHFTLHTFLLSMSSLLSIESLSWF